MISLAGEDPELTAAIGQLERMAGAEGIAFETADYGGVRTEADTTTILKYRADDYAVYVAAKKKQGQTPLPIDTYRPIAPYGESYHNAGAARDLKPISWPKGKSFTWAQQRLAELARDNPSLKLRPGFFFRRKDEPHFELAISLAEAMQRYKARLAGRSLRLGALIAGAVALFVAVRWLLRQRRTHSTS